MKKISSGKLSAMGYDRREKVLVVELDDGTLLEYRGIGEEIWRRLATSASAWSVYRDSIVEEYASRRISKKPRSGKNPLDELFE